MVVKLLVLISPLRLEFESSVISYGSKTSKNAGKVRARFESSVISYGSKTRG